MDDEEFKEIYKEKVDEYLEEVIDDVKDDIRADKLAGRPIDDEYISDQIDEICSSLGRKMAIWLSRLPWFPNYCEFEGILQCRGGRYRRLYEEMDESDVPEKYRDVRRWVDGLEEKVTELIKAI